MLEVVDIRLVWNAVRPGIEQIHAALPWVDWRPEDIYASCLNSESALITKQGVDASEAFMIVRMDVNQRTGEKILFMWLAWCPDETGAPDIYMELDQLAISNGCSAIEFITGEKKLVEFADKFGFKKVMYEVRKELPGPTAPGK